MMLKHDEALLSRIKTLQHMLITTATACHRSPSDILLLAVSKGRGVKDITTAYQAGLCDFAESYVQEAQEKIAKLQTLPIQWHFIGPIQSNKAKIIATYFSWVHSVDRFKVAKKLNDARPNHLPPLNICLEVNLDEEPNKAGIFISELLILAQQVLTLPNVRLRGLMSIPKPTHNQEQQYQSLLRLNVLLQTLNNELSISLDTLSMGMSDDFTAAIRAGSTMVRIGRALFDDNNFYITNGP